MERKILEIKKLKESFIKIKHESGLVVFLKPMKDFSTCVAAITTRFGSTTSRFKVKDEKEYREIPDGIAHYLEHKLFENEDGSITFELFAKEKASANAETSFEYTSYYFSSPFENFMANLKILLNYVQNPYFTEENVEKERGIITQEIKMEEDDPEWSTFFKCLTGMFKNSSVKIKIAGSVASIGKIDKNLLFECYNTFYNLNNMALVVVGNFEEKEVLDVLNSELKIKAPVEFSKFTSKEPYDVEERYCEQFMAVEMPMFCIGFKLKPKKGLDLLKFEVGIEILFHVCFGEGSRVYEEFYEENLVLGCDLLLSIFNGDDYFAFFLKGESKDPKRVLQKVLKEIENKKQNGIDAHEFDLVKKMVYKELIEQFSAPEKVAEFLTEFFVDGFSDEEFDLLKIIADFSLDDVLNCLSEIDENNHNLTITFPFSDRKPFSET